MCFESKKRVLFSERKSFEKREVSLLVSSPSSLLVLLLSYLEGPGEEVIGMYFVPRSSMVCVARKWRVAP